MITALSLVLFSSLLSSAPLTNADTTRMHVIEEVTVQSDLRQHETIAPQKICGEILERVSAHSVADALRLMSGVQVKDYGGLGGIKTVNLRSMGSQHVGIYYDGIELGNAQNGQIDLGQLSLDNIEEISVYNGQRSALMQTASDLVNAGSVYIRTKAPILSSVRPTKLSAKLQAGASRLTRGSVLWEQRINDRWILSSNVEGMASDGRYDFTYRRQNYDGTIAYDTTATRQNGDVQSLRAEANLWYRNERNEIAHVKAYSYQSLRGIPGAIVNNIWKRGERQGDNNMFIQSQWQKDFTQCYSLRAMAKYAYYSTHYKNKDTATMLIDQRYEQQEAYASMTHLFALNPHWNAAASYDLQYNTLWSDKPLFETPHRWTHHVGMASSVDFSHLQMQGSLVYSYFENTTKSNNNQTSHWTPALFLCYRPWLEKPLNFHAFVKQSYRMPTFNDLYYIEIGNANLLPEKAMQYSVGSLYKLMSTKGSDCYLEIGFDAYHNLVKDKIVAYPKGQQFRWTMLNLGRVEVNGLDIKMNGCWSFVDEFRLFAHLQYTYQQARDVTSEEDSYYQDQIPYTPWNSGSATLSSDWRKWALTYNFSYTGERYCQQENIRYNHLEPWYTSDLSLIYKCYVGKTRLQAILQVNNLFDQQYDVIINYPMPGRQFFGTIRMEL